MKLAIDASNLAGGTLTHLINLLNNVDEGSCRFSEIIIWSNKSTLEQLPQNEKIKKLTSSYFDLGWFGKFFWSKFILHFSLSKLNVDLLFSPGGVYLGYFRPYATMSQNMLVFKPLERARFGFSIKRIKLELLTISQKKTFKNAIGAIFLTEVARNLGSHIFSIPQKISIIPHGSNHLNSKKHIRNYGKQPFKLLYVSTIDFYKHQITVVRAISKLRIKLNLDLKLTLIGPLNNNYMKLLNKELTILDKARKWVEIKSNVKHQDIYAHYNDSDIFIFASTCENYPISLLEAMSAGLPIICSFHQPMKSILKDGGLYFNPENEKSLIFILKKLIHSKKLRKEFGEKAQNLALNKSWQNTSKETFLFLYNLVKNDNIN